MYITACTCDRRFSTGQCFDGDGRCQCLDNYSGPNCTQCNEGFYGFPNCKRELNFVCALFMKDLVQDLLICFSVLIDNLVGINIKVPCQKYCYLSSACDCHPLGTSGRVCGPTGDQCPCKPNYTGAKCDQCAQGYYGFPNCSREYIY